jgi:hypothetical protein
LVARNYVRNFNHDRRENNSKKMEKQKRQRNGKIKKREEREGFTDPRQNEEEEEGQALFLKTSRSARPRLGQVLIR